MSMLSEQVKHLLEIADRTQNEAFFCEWYKDYAKDLRQAADTIEALSAKVAVENTERSERYYGGGEESYAVEQILDAITQADAEVVSAIIYKDRDMLKDILKDYLHK